MTERTEHYPGALDRRRFLSSVGKGLGLAALSSSAVASLLKDVHAAAKRVARLSAEEAARDENFWFEIQQAFSVTRGMINLNNGGVSPSPRIVTEALVRYIWQQEDATAYTMWQILEPQSETIRTGLADLMGCDREEVAITRNTSDSLEAVLFGLDLKRRRRGADDDAGLPAHAHHAPAARAARQDSFEARKDSRPAERPFGDHGRLRSRLHAAHARSSSSRT